MFQISAMINLKTKFEGSSNCPCAKRNEEQRGSGRVCESRAKKKLPMYPPFGGFHHIIKYYNFYTCNGSTFYLFFNTLVY